MGRNDHKRPKSKYLEIHDAIWKLPPHLATYLAGPLEVDLDRLYIRRRGDGDWIIVLKAYDGDGQPVVVFGNGPDVVAAIIGVAGAIAADKWRPDVPWTPPK